MLAQRATLKGLMELRKKQTVPVAHRRQQQPDRPRVHVPSVPLSGGYLLAFFLVLIVLILMLYKPVSTYMEQRADIRRSEQLISQQEQEKQQLIDEIERYGDDRYVKEQARRRLGLVDKGELSFRVIDPAFEEGQPSQGKAEDQRSSKPWYQLMWDSLTEAPQLPNDQAPLPLPVEPQP